MIFSGFRSQFVSKVMVGLGLMMCIGILAEAKPSNKWRIALDGDARSDGDISFRVTPEGGEAIEVTAHIPKGTGENGVAKLIRDAFKKTLSQDQFHIERDDGEDVLVKKRRGAPNFDLELICSAILHLQIDLKRE